ncbi:hypothetical protein [Segetibacter aerophilus]|uniref:hypothetical protein n=1 Tax=Segetibacter aerophilus TaxID=670293 RepID=UPI0014795615|nr:hypothetical protein [Segetibacter aerophilus]
MQITARRINKTLFMLGLEYSKSVFGTGHIVAISLLLRRTLVLLFNMQPMQLSR